MKQFSLVLFFFWGILLVAKAQPGTGRISGTIKDTATGVAMESATVIIYKPDSTVFQFKITDKSGHYEITGLQLRARDILQLRLPDIRNSECLLSWMPQKKKWILFFYNQKPVTK